MKRIDISGQRFGRLTAIERRGKDWICLCDCGEKTQVYLGNLRGGVTKSCGCLRKQLTSIRKRQPIIKAIVKQIGWYYKRNATLRGIEWLITDSDVEALILSPCFYCGESGATKTKKHYKFDRGGDIEIRNNGIDRVDNKKDYTVDNVVPCCKFCNIAKMAMTREEFLAWVSKVYKHNNLGNS